MGKEIPIVRLGFIVVLCVGVEFFIIVRLAELQIFKYARYKVRVKEQAEAKIKVKPRRGRIYDRYLRIMATTIHGKRVYPLDNVGGNLIGFIGKDEIGLEGIEYQFDPLLSGKPGWMTLGKTPRGYLYPYPGYPQKDIEPAKDIVLTIDADIQAIIEAAMMKRVKQLKAKSGSAVVIRPNTGEILAMATVPSCNPNNWNNFKEWRNIPVQDEFEPGSTFKIVPLSIVVEQDLVALTDTVEEGKGEIIIKGIKIRDVRPHGPFTFAEAVWHSSNVAFVKLTNLVGMPQFYSRAVALGFGMPTGVELPGEANGNFSAPSKWDEIKFANLAFGQGVTCTLIQLAFAYQAIANGGVLLKPIIIKEVIAENGKVIYRTKPTTVRRVLDKEKARRVTELLCGVIENGSGILAKVGGLKMAGKTGTANKCVKGRYVSSYISSMVSFFPADEPKVLVALIIDEPKGIYLGGEVCGPVMKEITSKLIRLRSLNELT